MSRPRQEPTSTGLREPLVSVLVPSYNYGRYIEECIRSIWAQDRVNVECIVVDDGSSDNSVAIAERLAAQAPVPTQVIPLQHSGIVGALNTALSRAKGDFVSVLAADDRFHPEKSALQLEGLRRSPGATLAHCAFRTIDAAGNELPDSPSAARPSAEGECLKALLLGRVSVQTGYMVPRAFLDAIGGFDPNYPHEDWPLYLKAARNGPIVWLERPLVDRRIHGQNWSSTRFGQPSDVFTHAAVDLIEQFAPDPQTLDAALAYHLTRPLRVGLHAGELRWATSLLGLLIRRYPHLSSSFLREAGLGALSLVFRVTGKRVLPQNTALKLSSLARQLLDRQ